MNMPMLYIFYAHGENMSNILITQVMHYFISVPECFIHFGTHMK